MFESLGCNIFLLRLTILKFLYFEERQDLTALRVLQPDASVLFVRADTFVSICRHHLPEAELHLYEEQHERHYLQQRVQRAIHQQKQNVCYFLNN